MKEDVISVQRLVDTAMYTPRYSYPMELNAKKPQAPEFASVKLLNEESPGFDKQETIVNDDGTTTIRTTGSRLLIFEVLFTRGNSAVSQFTSSFYRQDMLNMMKAEDMSILRTMPIENETLTLETNWEIRFGVLVECLTRRVFEHTTDTISTTTVDGEVNEGTQVLEVEIDVDFKGS